MDEATDALAGLVSPTAMHYRWRPASVDAGNDLVLEAAVNGCADAIATFNVRHVAAAAAPAACARSGRGNPPLRGDEMFDGDPVSGA